MKRAPKFVLAGTPRQVESRLNQLEWQLERGARDLHRRAARIERLIARIKAKRATGKAISRDDLCQAVNHGEGEGRYQIAKLAGVENYEGRVDFIRQICNGPTPTPIPLPRPPMNPPPASPAPLPAAAKFDPVAAAMDIIRTASEADLDIDWTQEPRSERERKIRAALIAKASKGFAPFSALHNLAGYDSLVADLADDIATAIDEAEDAMERKRAERRRKEIQDAAREVDGR